MAGRTKGRHAEPAAHDDADTSVLGLHQGIEKDDSGQVTGLTGELHLEGSVKTTKLKLTWLPQACLTFLLRNTATISCGDVHAGGTEDQHPDGTGGGNVMVAKPS